MTVKLYTREGGFVTEATIPPFLTMPDVVLWGERFFCIPDVDGLVAFINADLPDDVHAYVEAFSYAIPVTT